MVKAQALLRPPLLSSRPPDHLTYVLQVCAISGGAGIPFPQTGAQGFGGAINIVEQMWHGYVLHSDRVYAASFIITWLPSITPSPDMHSQPACLYTRLF